MLPKICDMIFRPFCQNAAKLKPIFFKLKDIFSSCSSICPYCMFRHYLRKLDQILMLPKMISSQFVYILVCQNLKNVFFFWQNGANILKNVEYSFFLFLFSKKGFNLISQSKCAKS